MKTLAKPYIRYGKKMFRNGKLDAAIREYRKALQLNPESAEAFFHLAAAQYIKGERKRAMRSMKRARRLAPDHSYRENQAKVMLDYMAAGA